MSIAAGLGLMEYPFDGAASYWRWVDMCEAGGVDSLWQTDRLLSREPMLECMTAMAAQAGRTRRIKFGMNVVSLALRDPVLVAKQCATIDVLSEGRLLPAFGIGSPRAPEWGALHVDTTTRGRKTDEGLEIIRRLWSEDSVNFIGEHFHLTAASISPKPLQANLPMWIGGASAPAVRRTARIGTGWQGGPETPAEAQRVVAAIKAALADAGRSIDHDHYGASFPFYFGRSAQPVLERAMTAYSRRTGNDAAAYFAVGDADTILERIAQYVRAGISKFILRPVGESGAEVLAQTGRLIEDVLPKMASLWPRQAKAAVE
jgi:probable F420-dependent oxidoreductase